MTGSFPKWTASLVHRRRGLRAGERLGRATYTGPGKRYKWISSGFDATSTRRASTGARRVGVGGGQEAAMRRVAEEHLASARDRVRVRGAGEAPEPGHHALRRHAEDDDQLLLLARYVEMAQLEAVGDDVDATTALRLAEDLPGREVEHL